MTYEEAINHIKPIFEASRDVSGIGLFEQRPITVALGMAIEALEKRIPKKPPNHDRMVCPSCNSKARYGHPHEYYCPHCGQAILSEVSDEET